MHYFFHMDPSITFLKVEAEGYEIEVLEGMNTFLPYKIVVDVSPERGGESPRREIEELLIKKGCKLFYHTKKSLFAKL